MHIETIDRSLLSGTSIAETHNKPFLDKFDEVIKQTNGEQVQVLYVGKHGLDSNTGKGINDAFLTFGAAILRAISLTPSATNRIAIKCTDAGKYEEDITVPMWCGILAESAEIVGNHIVVDNSLFTCFRLTTSSGVGITKSTGSGKGHAFCEFVNLTGSANGFLCTSGSLNTNGQSIVVENGYGIGSMSTSHIHSTFEYIEITGTGVGVGLASSGVVGGDIVTINDIGGNGTCLYVGSTGTLNLVISNISTSNVAYNVAAIGATLNLIVASLTGSVINLGTANITTAGSDAGITTNAGNISTNASDISTIEGRIDDGTILGYLSKETKVGDEGVNCIGEFHVGAVGAGRESVFGEGDSHTEGMVVLSTADGINFVDFTLKAQDLDSDPFDMLNGGVVLDASLYVGADEEISGFKFYTYSLLTLGAGTIVREFWNGVAWEPFVTLVTKSGTPYTQRADNIGTVTGSEQIRFGGHIGQAKKVIEGYDKFWVRFRVTVPITASGEVDQIKLHTNRFEINPDGFTEYFGTGIYTKDLVMHWHLTEQLSGFSPGNEDVTFANGLAIVYKDNEFLATVTDGRAGYILIPEGLDTSHNLEIEVLWTPLSDLAGDVVWNIDTYQTKVGDTLDSSNTVTTIEGIETIVLNSDNLLRQTTISVAVSNLLPGEILAFGLKRIGGDVLDTYASNVALVNVRAVGYFWKP